MLSKLLRGLAILAFVSIAPGCCALCDRWRGNQACRQQSPCCCSPCDGRLIPAPAATIPPTPVPIAAGSAPGCN